jgi:hypothetical protein
MRDYENVSWRFLNTLGIVITSGAYLPGTLFVE